MSIVRIKDVDVNLKDIGIDFELNEDQIGALNNLANFLEDPASISTTLSGSAGTGKTACTRVLLEYTRRKGDEFLITLAAPTHKAKAVLKRLAGGDQYGVTTLHKLLNLKPIVNIAEFDAKDIQFSDALDLDFVEEVKQLIIIDESSLINDILFDLIISKLGRNAKIIFLGDHAQLAPVKQDELSKVFNSVDYPGTKLTKVERQVNGNPLIKSLVILRDDYILPQDFETEISADMESGIIVHDNAKEFVKEIRDTYKEELEFNSDGLGSKVLCFTNSRVAQFNVAIRKVLGYKDVLVEGEILTGTDNYTSDRVYKDPLSKESEGYCKYGELYNANDYIVYKMENTKKSIPFYRTVDGIALTLIDTTDNLKHHMFLIDPNAEKIEYDDLASVLENLRLKAIDKTTPYKSRNSYWSAWYAINKAFVSMYDLVYDQRVVKKASLTYGYATTVHKSQGSSYDHVFVDMLDIMRCLDKNAIRSLQYVALSRARKKAHLLC